MTASAPRPCIDQRRSAIPLAEGVLARISEAAMSVAIISLFQDGGSPLSAWATTLWIALEALRQTRSLPWSWGLVAILLLNLRGIVRSDGPQPISHMDWVLIIAAFLVGFGRSSLAWRRSAALACCACMAGVLLKGPEVWEFAWWGIAYKLPTLTQNQTALLAGFCTMAGIQALLLGRRRIWLLLMVPCVVGCLVLVRATSSRAGLGLVPISLLLALAVNGRSQLWNWSSQWLRKAWPWLLPLPWIGLAGLLLLRGVRWSQLASLYGSENALNDLGRIHVYRCYLGLPFLGENRLLYGVGYQNSWQKWCTAEVIGRPLSHAHNLLLQIWGDTGAISSAFVLVCLGLMLRRLWQNGKDFHTKNLAGLATSSAFIYLLGFNMVELGMMKVPILTALFGYFLASIFYSDQPLNPHPGSPHPCGPQTD